MATILGNPLIIGTASARLKYSFTGTYQEREDGTIEFLSSGTFRLYKAMEVDMWGIGAGGAGASNNYTSGEGGPAGGGGNFTFISKYALAAGTYEVTIGAGGTGNGGTTSFADILTATGGTAGDGSKGRTSVGKGTSGNGGVGSTAYTGSGSSVNATPGKQNDECREFNSATGTLRGGGGGGGQTWDGTRAEGSAGGGGYGAIGSTAAADGTPNSGAGGGGGVYKPKGLQGKGGSGLLLIRPTQF